MRPDHLLQLAAELADVSARRPRRTDLCRATSTAYYALFHCLARACADALAGAGGSRTAWRQVYRALEHGQTKRCCGHPAMREFPARPSVNSIRRLLQFVSSRYCVWVQNPWSAVEPVSVQPSGVTTRNPSGWREAAVVSIPVSELTRMQAGVGTAVLPVNDSRRLHDERRNSSR